MDFNRAQLFQHSESIFPLSGVPGVGTASQISPRPSLGTVTQTKHIVFNQSDTVFVKRNLHLKLPQFN